MRRAVGAGLILCASLLTRRTLLDGARTAQGARRALAAAFETMEAEIRLLLTPLPTLLRRPYDARTDTFFARALQELERGAPLREAWRRAAQTLPLPEEERELVACMGGRLSGDEESVRAALMLCARQLREQSEAAERRHGQDERLTTALCLSAGLLAAILLI